MDRKPAVEKCCSVLLEDPKETCDSSQDSFSVSDGLSSCEEFGHVTGKTPAPTGLSPGSKYNVVTYPGKSPLVRAVAVGADRNAPWRKDMEDTNVIIDSYGGKEGTSFFGVFDGFHGRSSTEWAARELSVLLLEQLVKLDPSFSLDSEQRDFLSQMKPLFERTASTSTEAGTTSKDQQMTQAFTTAFAHMDRLLGLGRNESSKIRWSGCTSVVCIVDQETAPEEDHNTLHGRMLIANCGNIHAVVYKTGKSFCLTKDHSLANPRERKRILKEGGTISSNKQHGLVEGLLRATRGLGNYGNRRLRKVVPPTPYFMSLSLDASVGLLVLGSSGLWDGLQPEEVAPIVRWCSHDCLKHHRHANAAKGHHEGLDRSKLRETTEDPDNQERCNERPPCGVTLGDQQGAAPMSQPKNPSDEEEAGRDAGVEVDYEWLAASICRKLMKGAVAGGSRENISVIVILLRGLDVLSVQSDNGV
ncbi:protein phosphatase 2C-like domain-containing protein 1 [Alosa sapidissima]|uniref:protein phosphatase 2C-like domain-containing protein 1 n=1 Tax=Alosa sapidissima TaxID=34773 RepID=UPI001C085509|nr:protein phosphatase 2C-like domain-containing protein 1 [Alosa sapidissima]